MLSLLNIELPCGTLVSWNFFFHEVEWLQTRTPPLCFMHSSIGIGSNPPVKRFPETTLIAANITIRYGRLPQQGSEQGYEYIQGTLIVTQQKPNSKATEHTLREKRTHTERMRLTTHGDVYFFLRKLNKI